MILMSITGLSVTVGGRQALRGIDLHIDKGEILGLVGESGAGKSMTAYAVMGLLPPRSQAAGRIEFAGKNLLEMDERSWCRFRGGTASIVFQEPMTALNPLLSIGDQIAEGIRAHGAGGRSQARDAASQLLERVGLDPQRVGPERYPHELSGGQRQRVVIAMAIALRPRLLIADEPTTALDVTTQARVLELLKSLVEEHGTSLLLITHDLGVVAGMANRVAIMKDGEIVEHGPCPGMFRAIQHPYSSSLLKAASPAARRPLSPSADSSAKPVLAAENVVRTYRHKGYRSTKAVRGVSLEILPGERVGLVGESGCGKTTLTRALLGLEPPDDGQVKALGRDMFRDTKRIQLRRSVQAVFQDPYGSLNPRHRIGRSIAEPLHLLRPRPSLVQRRKLVAGALEEVGLSPDDACRYPHEFSGGQRQRIAIARALVLRPAMVVFDEPVSSLDVTVRAQILALLDGLNRRLGLAYLFISHDLTVVRSVADRVLVMREGEIVEEGCTERVLDSPQHPYTRALIDAAPNLERILGRAG